MDPPETVIPHHHPDNTMEFRFEQLDKHYDLLANKGYFSEHFKTATQLGYWLREFEDQYRQAVDLSVTEGGPRRFVIESSGQFNHHLDRVNFRFHYQYDPSQDHISLQSIRASMGKVSERYLFKKPIAFPEAQEVYDVLLHKSVNKQKYDLYKRLQREFHLQRDPLNDHKAEKKSIAKPPAQRKFTLHR